MVCSHVFTLLHLFELSITFANGGKAHTNVCPSKDQTDRVAGSKKAIFGLKQSKKGQTLKKAAKKLEFPI